MEKRLFIVSMLQTSLNKADYDAMLDNGENPQVIMDDPIAAAHYAVDKGWYPFIVEAAPHIEVS